MSKTPKNKKRKHNKRTKPILSSPKVIRAPIRIADIDMCPYYSVFGKNLSFDCPILVAVDELPEGQSSYWGETEKGDLVLLFTSSLSPFGLEVRLEKGPQDNERILMPPFQLLTQVHSLMKCSDLSKIYHVASLVASTLNIPCPQVFPSDRMSLSGELYCNGKLAGGKPYIILIKAGKSLISIYKTISHEIRHAWQHYTDPEKYFSDYHVLSDYPGNREEKCDLYFRQEAELDAEAYALAFTHYHFDLPLNWRQYSEITSKNLESRAKEYLACASEFHMSLGA